MFDTIVAPITGSPPCAVAWVRLSGPESWWVASCLFAPWPLNVEPRRAVYGRYGFGDDGLALPFEAGHSYTGEETVELSIHGSRASISALVEACISQGARLAEPGEFTLRAFMNGKMDLTQAEGVRESCEAETERQLRLAESLRKGRLRDRVRAIRDELLGELAALEASVDFSEEIGEFDKSACKRKIGAMFGQFGELLDGGRMAQLVREGFRLAIVGPPNAGKSSLMNYLLGSERSIVTDIPGTTRDFLEERIVLDGMPVVLVDTAGLRETADKVESIGVERTVEIALDADAVWYVIDSVTGLTPKDEELMASLRNQKITLVANKSDLQRPTNGVPVSAKTGEGVRELLVQTCQVKDSGCEALLNRRQTPILEEASRSLSILWLALGFNEPDDLLSTLFSTCIEELGQITGETASPDMIERIFHDFCIGK